MKKITVKFRDGLYKVQQGSTSCTTGNRETALDWVDRSLHPNELLAGTVLFSPTANREQGYYHAYTSKEIELAMEKVLIKWRSKAVNDVDWKLGGLGFDLLKAELGRAEPGNKLSPEEVQERVDKIMGLPCSFCGETNCKTYSRHGGEQSAFLRGI